MGVGSVQTRNKAEGGETKLTCWERVTARGEHLTENYRAEETK